MPPALGGSIAQAADTGPQRGLLITIAATVDPPAAGSTEGSLLLQLWLDNQTGQDVAGMAVRAGVPSKATVADTWLTQPGRDRAAIEGSAVAWYGVAIKTGDRVGPFSYRLTPQGDGAVLFRDATVQPEVTWTQPSASKTTGPTIRLNGLWGETGLRRTILPTGLTIFTRERPDTASVALEMAVRAGSRDEDDTTWGGSHWLEHAHFLGTAKRPNNQAIFGPIDEVGGDINASTSHEYTEYHNLVPADQFDLGLDILSDQLLNSTFPEDAFDRERRVVFEELKRDADDPSRHATDEFFRQVFQVSPLHRDAGGYVDTVATIPISTILAHRARFYITGNMCIAAIGNVRHDEAVAKITQAFAALPRGPRSERPRTPEPVETAPRRLDLGDGANVVELRVGWPVPGDDSPDSVVMEVLQDILGLTGRRLLEDIRDRKGLTADVSPSNAVFSDAGAFLISASAPAANADAVLQAILAQVQRIRDGDVSAQDVEASKRARAGQRALAEELNEAQAGMATIEVSGVLDSYAEYLARIAPVTPSDVVRVARTYLDPVNFTLVTVRS